MITVNKIFPNKISKLFFTLYLFNLAAGISGIWLGKGNSPFEKVILPDKSFIIYYILFLILSVPLFLLLLIFKNPTIRHLNQILFLTVTTVTLLPGTLALLNEKLDGSKPFFYQGEIIVIDWGKGVCFTLEFPDHYTLNIEISNPDYSKLREEFGREIINPFKTDLEALPKKHLSFLWLHQKVKIKVKKGFLGFKWRTDNQISLVKNK